MESSVSSWTERVNRAATTLPQGPVYSSWFEVAQRDMDLYMESVHDTDPTHLDADWCKTHTPYGGPIAAGMWVASMLVAMLHDSKVFEKAQQELGIDFGLNYGYDRFRFIRPVPIGTRIRGRFDHARLTVEGENQALFRMHATVELPDGEGPAVVADWIGAFLKPEEI